MDIKDIFERTILKSGQYIMARGKVEINVDAFRILVEDSLAVYNRISPHDVVYNKEIYYPRQFDWSKDIDPNMGRVPDWISTCNPMRYGGGSIGGIMLNPTFGASPELIDPLMSPWRYDKPLLTVSQSGRYEIRAVYDHVVEESQPDPNGEKIYEIKTITPKDQALFDHIRAHFLQGIGRSRRAFTLDDLPIKMDADQIISDGVDLEEKAMTRMQSYQKFYLTYG